MRLGLGKCIFIMSVVSVDAIALPELDITIAQSRKSTEKSSKPPGDPDQNCTQGAWWEEWRVDFKTVEEVLLCVSTNKEKTS